MSRIGGQTSPWRVLNNEHAVQDLLVIQTTLLETPQYRYPMDLLTGQQGLMAESSSAPLCWAHPRYGDEINVQGHAGLRKYTRLWRSKGWGVLRVTLTVRNGCLANCTDY